MAWKSDAPLRAAAIPQIDPADWESYDGFRETLLLHVTDPGANATLRNLGTLLGNLVLEYSRSWPAHEGGLTRAELRAALADLRYLEGFLRAIGGEQTLSSLDTADDALSECAAREAIGLGAVADRIEKALQG